MGRRPCLILLVALAGCPREPDPPPSPPPQPEPAPSACEPACARFQELDCEEGKPTPGGAPCEDVCRNAEESGALTLNPLCVLGAVTCQEARRCIQ